MQIVIVGTGYVGLVTGACFAEMGHQVLCLDIDEKKIEQLKKGIVPIFEPGLEELVKRNTQQHRLHFSSSYEEAALFADIFFLALPTPSREDGSCEIRFIEEAAKRLAKIITRPSLFVNKSTVPVGTANRVKQIITSVLEERAISLSFDVVSNPEFLKEGAAVHDCLKPDRIVIGADSPLSAETMRQIYAPFMINCDKMLFMDAISAELTKYAANAMLAMRISFMNEMADLCEKLNANVNEVRKGMGADPRIGPYFLYAGIGYGGSCFPKDIRALISIAEKQGGRCKVLKAVDEVNQIQKEILAQSVVEYFERQGGLKGKTIGVWGLSFKPDTDDMREAPSLNFIEALLEEGALLRLFDPVAMEKAKKIIPASPQITWCADEFEAASGADAVALLTEWKQFRLVDFKALEKRMNHKAFFDGRNQYKPEEVRKRGFYYKGIGIPNKT